MPSIPEQALIFLECYRMYDRLAQSPEKGYRNEMNQGGRYKAPNQSFTVMCRRTVVSLPASGMDRNLAIFCDAPVGAQYR